MLVSRTTRIRNTLTRPSIFRDISNSHLPYLTCLLVGCRSVSIFARLQFAIQATDFPNPQPHHIPRRDRGLASQRRTLVLSRHCRRARHHRRVPLAQLEHLQRGSRGETKTVSFLFFQVATHR